MLCKLVGEAGRPRTNRRAQPSLAATVARFAWLFFVLAVAAGCNNTKALQNRGQQAEPWFCEMNELGDDWDCVQDESLARTPAPKRLPHPDGPPPAPEASASLSAPAAGAAAVELDATSSTAVGETDDLATSDAIVTAVVEEALSVEPDMLLELPEDYFVVQLLAMNNASQVEDYVAARGLENTVSVQISYDEKLMHILLLGVFRTYEQAQQAILERPASLDDSEPWIRPLGTLQQAMLEAQAMSAAVE